MKMKKLKLPVIVSGFSESIVEVAEEKSEGKLVIKGLAVPFGKVSSNGVLYNKESLIETLPMWKACPVMYNHQIEGDSLPIGKILNMTSNEDGLHYEVEIDSNETKICEKIKNGYLNKVSIHILPRDVSVRSGYQEAVVGRPLEFSVVPVPGFMETDMEAYVERLNLNVNKEGDKKMVTTIKSSVKPKNFEKVKTLIKSKIEGKRESKELKKEFFNLKRNVVKSFASKTDLKKVLSLVEEYIDKEKGTDIIGEVDNHESALKDAAEVLEAVLNRLDRIEAKIMELSPQEPTTEEEVVEEEVVEEEEIVEEEPITEEESTDDEEEDDKEEKIKKESSCKEFFSFADLERKNFSANVLHLK
jgi:hypothetical protein